MVETTSTPGQYALSVNYKGRPTRHKVAPNADDGTLSINGKAFGAHMSIEGLVAALSSDTMPTGWPVKLTRPGRVASGGEPAAPTRQQRNSDSTPASPPPAQSSPSWLHGEISREEASGTVSFRLDSFPAFVDEPFPLLVTAPQSDVYFQLTVWHGGFAGARTICVRLRCC